MKYAKIEIEDKILFVQTDAKEDKRKEWEEKRELVQPAIVFRESVSAPLGKESSYNSLS